MHGLLNAFKRMTAFALLPALVISFAPGALHAAQTEAEEPYTVIDEITVKLAALPGLEITMTNVYSLCQEYAINVHYVSRYGYVRPITFYCTGDTTVAFNRDVTLYNQQRNAKDAAASAGDFKMEFNCGTAQAVDVSGLGFNISALFTVNDDGYKAFDYKTGKVQQDDELYEVVFADKSDLDFVLNLEDSEQWFTFTELTKLDVNYD